MSSDPNFALDFNINQFAKDMTTSKMFLEGLLDGLMILAQSTPSQSINFRNHKFPDGEISINTIKLKKRIEELFQLFTKIIVYFDLTNRNSRLRWRI